MKQLVTPARIRSAVSGAHTEMEAAALLRQRGIKYSFSTEGGTFHIRVPSRSGCVRIIRTASRSAPLIVSPAAPVPYRPQAPLLRYDY